MLTKTLRKTLRRTFAPSLFRAGGVWTPEQLATLRQWLGSTYYSSPVGGLQVIESLETHGTVRAPQPGCCGLFDGTNDKGDTAAVLPTGTTPTISFWVKPTALTGGQRFCSSRDGSNNGFDIFLSSSKVSFYNVQTGGVSSTTSLTAGVWQHVAIVIDGSTIRFYLNGVADGTEPCGFVQSSVAFTVADFSGAGLYGGSMRDLRIYSTIKSAPEVAALAACDFTNLDKTGIVGHWYFNDREGTVARDSSGNGHDLTLSGPITEATFWAEDSSITANPANVLGYTLSGSTIIPRDESDITKDVQGNALQYTGLSPYPVTIETPCITFNGITTDYATLTSINAGTVHTFSAWAKITADAIFLSSAGPNNYSLFFYSGEVWYRANSVTVNFAYSPPSGWAHYAVVRNGTAVKFYVNGAQVGTTQTLGANENLTLTQLAFAYNSLSVASMALHSDAKSDAEILAMFQGTENRTNLLRSWKCQEGPGTSNTNKTLYDDSGNGNHLTVVGGTVAAQRANRCPGYVRDHAFEYGGRLTNQNLLTYSEDQSNAAWVAAGSRGVTFTTNTVSDPFGGNAADTATMDNSGGTPYWGQRKALVSGTTYTYSIYAKAGTANLLGMSLYGSGYYAGGATSPVFDLSSGTITTPAANGSAAIEPVVEFAGWYRISVTGVSDLSGNNDCYIASSQSGTVHLFAGQLEAASSVGTYEKAVASPIPHEVFVPLVPGTSLCADGNAATIAAGTIPGSGGNPYSRVDFDPYDAAELGALNVPGEFDSLPCVTLNGSNNIIDFSSALLPPTANFDFSFYYYHPSTAQGGMFEQTHAALTSWFIVLANSSNTFQMYIYDGTNTINETLACLVVGQWHRIRCTRVGNVFTATCSINGSVVGTLTDTSAMTLPSANSVFGTYLLGHLSAGRFSNLNTGTKLFPLTDSSGDDIAMYENGVATVISNAIQGTLTNVWANKTDGQVDHEFPEATRAIVPRDTKFTNGSTKTITTSEPATGADLASILGYIG